MIDNVFQKPTKSISIKHPVVVNLMHDSNDELSMRFFNLNFIIFIGENADSQICMLSNNYSKNF